MIYLRMTDLLLSPPVTHISTDWQVASDLQFTTIIAQSLGDTVNLSTMLFNNPLDPEIKYYARGRVLLSTGYTAWSNIDIFTPEDVGSGTTHAPLPSLVTIPQIALTNSGLDVPTYGAVINISPVDTLGSAAHESTSYVIEDSNGIPVWSSLYNVDNKSTKVIPPDVLIPNSLYRLRVLVHVDSRDTAQLVTTTFKTETRTQGLLMGGLTKVDPNASLTVDITPDVTVTGVTAILYANINGTLTQVATYTATGAMGNIITVPSAALKPNTKYLLRVNTSNPAIWDHRSFTTTA